MIELEEQENKLIAKRYGMLNGVKQVEKSTFYKAGSNGTHLDDYRLTEVEGVEGQWFWFNSENFLGDVKALQKAVNLKGSLHPFKLPLDKEATIITKQDFYGM